MSLDYDVREDAFQPQGVQMVAELIIVGQIFGNCRKSADAVEIRSSKSHGRTQCELIDANQVCYQCGGREVGRNSQAFETSCGAACRYPVKARHQPDTRIG